MHFSQKTNDNIKQYLSLYKHNVIGIAIYNKGKESAFNLDKTGLVNNDFIYDLGSISKTFTAHLVLKMIEDQELDLNTRIDHYLNLKKGHYPSIKELLSHTSGYNYLTPISITVPGFIFHPYSRENIYANITEKDVIKHIKPVKNKIYQTSYSDFNYAVLAVIISKIKGCQFSEILEGFIHQSLNLNSTSMAYSNIRNLESFKGNKKVKFWQWESDNPYLSGGGISTTILDIKNYLKLELNSHKNFILKSHENQGQNKRVISCFGWFKKHHSNKLFSVGRVGCFSSYILLNPHRQIGVAILTNSGVKKTYNACRIANEIYTDLARNKVDFS